MLCLYLFAYIFIAAWGTSVAATDFFPISKR